MTAPGLGHRDPLRKPGEPVSWQRASRLQKFGAWFYLNFLPHPERSDNDEYRQVAVFRFSEPAGWAWGGRTPGGRDLAREGKMLPCLLLSGQTHGRFLTRGQTEIALKCYATNICNRHAVPFVNLKPTKVVKGKNGPDVDLHATLPSALQWCWYPEGNAALFPSSFLPFFYFCEFSSAVLLADGPMDAAQWTRPWVGCSFNLVLCGSGASGLQRAAGGLSCPVPFNLLSSGPTGCYLCCSCSLHLLV